MADQRFVSLALSFSVSCYQGRSGSGGQAESASGRLVLPAAVDGDSALELVGPWQPRTAPVLSFSIRPVQLPYTEGSAGVFGIESLSAFHLSTYTLQPKAAIALEV